MPTIAKLKSYRNAPANILYWYKYEKWQEMNNYVKFILKNYFFKMF